MISGLGVVAPNGIGKDRFWANLVAGVSAVGPVTTFDASACRSRVAGEVRDFDPLDFMSPSRTKTMGRFAQFAVAAARLAATDAALSRFPPSRTGVCIGSAVQGIGDIGENAHSDFLTGGLSAIQPPAGLEVTGHAATVHVQQELGVSGPTTTVASACCTGIDAIAWGANAVRNGVVDVALVGAAEAPLSQFVFGLFLASGHLTTWAGPPSQASRPYDLHRCGLVLSEGSAVLVLEELEHARARRAPVYAEVLGYASVGEGSAHGLEERYSAALEMAILQALDASGLRPGDLDYICSHGNSTRFDDRAEAEAHRRSLGQYAYRIPVSSIKSMIGQPFSASGAMQAVATALAVRHNVVPPTINYEVPDPDCDLDYVPNRARTVRVHHALFHSHSLGGRVSGSHSVMVIADLAA